MADRINPDRIARDVMEERIFGEIHPGKVGGRNRDPERGDGRGIKSY